MSASQLLRRPIAAALIGAGSVALPAGALYLYGSSPHAAEQPFPVTAAAQASRAPTTTLAALPDFRGLVEREGPAVVNISVRATVQTAAQGPQMPGFGPDDPFSQFFRGMPGPRGNVPMRGEGSGFIVSADGLILTNAHVVAGADKVTVKLLDRREFEAKVVGQDEATDVAVLKIEASGLPAVKLAKADSVQVGEWVVAIGAPFGFDNSVTAGIVSAKGRSLPDDNYVPFINSQIYSRSGGYQGVSFAIPIDVAMNVSKQLQASGHVTRGRLGVGIQDVDQALAETFGLETPHGALVASVENDGPAAKAGIEPGDVILSFNGRTIDTAGALPTIVAAVKPGTRATVEVWRDKAKHSFDVRLGENTDTQSVASAAGDAEGGRLGLAVRPLSADEKREAEVENGLVVEGVQGASEEAGIRPGDIVLSANGKPVHDIEELRAAVAKSKQHVALLVQRGDNRLFVPVELG
jgi:serine protease Do